jgi:hypothetical protein
MLCLQSFAITYQRASQAFLISLGPAGPLQGEVENSTIRTLRINVKQPCHKGHGRNGLGEAKSPTHHHEKLNNMMPLCGPMIANILLLIYLSMISANLFILEITFFIKSKSFGVFEIFHPMCPKSPNGNNFS